MPNKQSGRLIFCSDAEEEEMGEVYQATGMWQRLLTPAGPLNG
jgi:hypothetical protein